MAQKISEVMSSDPISIPLNESVREAARVMRDADIGDVIVLDESQKVCGIVTDRDITIRLVADGWDPIETRLGEIVTRDVVTLSPDDSVDDAVRLMSEKAIRRLPITQDGKPVGIVSLGDLAVTQDPESALADISASPPDR